MTTIRAFFVLLLAAVASLGGCSDDQPSPPQGRPVAMVFFDLDSASVGPSGVEIVNALSREFAANDKKIDLRGHADEAESAKSISKARANAIMKLMAERGISSSRMQSHGEAANRPIFKGEKDPQNRRVEIYLN